LASDSGTSEGYWADGGSYWVPAVYTPGYYTYAQVWFPGTWVYRNDWIPAHWIGEPPYGTYVLGRYEEVATWVEGAWHTVATWHEAVNVPGHWADYPDVWVPEGPSQLSAAFCSIREYPEVSFVSRPIMWG
jgi:hypothetical protein